MFCSKCGANNPDDGRFCVACGATLQPGQSVAPAAAQPAMAPPIPGLAPPHAGPTETSGKAIASLICGIFFLIFPAAVAAIILGHLSISEISKSAGRLTGRGLATAGLVLGYFGAVGLIPFILIIAAIAIPNLIRATTVANETSAVTSLRTIYSAAQEYSSTYSNGFPDSLEALDGSNSGVPNCEHAHLIDRTLATGQKNGYFFEYVATGAAVAGVNARTGGCPIAGTQSFHINAYPVRRGTTGFRGFYVDETGVIRVEQNRVASANSPELGGDPEKF